MGLRHLVYMIMGFQQDTADVLDSGGQMDCVAIDLSKAFDRVDHGRLLTKMSAIGLDKIVTDWVAIFLENRTQRIRVGDALSDPVVIKRGIPQGSIIGPLCFLIYINDMSKELESEIRLFADDVIIYRVINKLEDCERLQKDLDNVARWTAGNGMMVNGAKSQVVSFTNRRSPLSFNYCIDGVNVPHGDHCKYLGVNIRKDLHWGNHINTIVNQGYRSLHIVMRVFKGCSKDVKERAYKSLLRPQLEYGSSVWDPH